MNPYPKPKRIKLSPKELSELKSEISGEQNYYCANKHCGQSIIVSGHLHHKKSKGSGGDDSKDNCIVLCWKCHHKVHTGELKL